MSAGADPVRVYWYWRRKLLDPATEPEQAVAASTILLQMEKWYPTIARSRPPKNEGSGEDMSNPWDFLATQMLPYAFTMEQQSVHWATPFNWQRGTVGWVFSPEVPGRYGYVVGATETDVCIVVEGDPRLDGKHDFACDPTLYIWVKRGSIHIPVQWSQGGGGNYFFSALRPATVPYTPTLHPFGGGGRDGYR